MRARVFDCFPFNNELDMLECRLTELYDAVDGFVLVEANVDHQDHPKPFHYLANRQRFDRWADKIVDVQIKGFLPTLAENPDPWAREHAQREFIITGLTKHGATDNDIVLQSDVDEIPRALQARNVRPSGLVAFEQRLHCFAVDWLHPDPWRGTVAGRFGTIKKLGSKPFSFMRDARNVAPCPPALRDAGWHLSWLGGRTANMRKLDSFCHPEIADRTLDGLWTDSYYLHGIHVDGVTMSPVDVDDSWPRWIVEGRAPATWFRRREVHGPGFADNWFGQPSQDALARLVEGAPMGVLVEVGSWEGRSTCAMANAAYPRIVVAIDTWKGSPNEISAKLALTRDVFAQFTANIEAFTKGNVEPMRMNWRQYKNPDPVALVFIDAEHSYDEVKATIEAFRPLMVSGGIMCGDDFHHPPVAQAVADTLGVVEREATLWVWRAP